MKTKETSQFLALGAVVVLVVAFLLTQTSVGQFVLASPWWTYLLILGIVFSGYQWIRALKEEKEIDEDFIEQEGNVYMERIQEAKKLKEQQEL
ncbi:MULTISPECIES: sporulation YhaL family protein [Shouchella]|uniref:Sporulation YhaL family protein n=2 Tax=Shouchella TaxID=2893057 RepID=A0ABY7W5Q2_9BACI|nr:MULTISPECIES: sporulation YhaL family protein [Shouchella]MED4129571.1 sporulation YhaL family protein [Shouchella miscanthi]WDF02831.1 sporulation YhaL family protein [Shouchella hunanensis]